MHKKRLLYFLEPQVRTILEKRLAKEGYTIFAKVALQDVIGRDPSEYLPSRDFGFWTRSHLDFVVAQQDMPVFAVEFDGIDHLHNPETIERDAIKNRLCKSADLPLLRITATELREYDQFTLLDYMLMRYVAWKREHEDLMSEIREFAESLPPDADLDDYSVDLDPTFQFDLKHPFPGIATVRERLLRHYGLSWMVSSLAASRGALVYELLPGASGSIERDQFHTSEVRCRVWSADDANKKTLFEDTVAVTIRSWLPLKPNVPSPESLDFWTDRGSESLEALKLRIEAMWFPNLPGLEASSISETYAEYLGFRAIERWAKAALPRKRQREHDDQPTMS